LGQKPTQNGDMNTNQGGRPSAASRHIDRPILTSPVSEGGAARLAWALTALSALLLVLAVVLLVLNWDLGFRALSAHLLVPGSPWSDWCWLCAAPATPIGWLFVGMGLVAAVHAFAFEYAIRGFVTAPGSLPRLPGWPGWPPGPSC
jgi:hypothetical protein